MCPHATTKNWTSDLSIKQEYAANLGDKRRTRRATALGLELSRNPWLSLQNLLPDESDLEAAYRFIRKGPIQTPLLLDNLGSRECRPPDGKRAAKRHCI